MTSRYRLPSKQHRNLSTVIGLVDFAGWATIVLGAIGGLGLGGGLAGDDVRAAGMVAGLLIGGAVACVPAAFAFALGYVLRLLADVADAGHITAIVLDEQRG